MGGAAGLVVPAAEKHVAAESMMGVALYYDR